MVVESHHHHRDVQTGGARAAVFGVSDGLVSNVALILGVAGAHASGGAVRLAGVAGLIAGSFSMAAGEYVSMRAQGELMQRELDVEAQSIERDPEVERRELAAIYVSRGLDANMADELSGKMMRDPEIALETHAREELGIDPTRTGRPFQAAAFSFVTFAVGALVPLLPWLITAGTTATIWSVVLGGASALAVGAALAHFTGRSALWSAGRQLIILGIAAGVTFSIGRLIGTG
ncbi:MAG: VIT1/CCC1 transporter family protein [Acidimicrobiales bacterium]